MQTDQIHCNVLQFLWKFLNSGKSYSRFRLYRSFLVPADGETVYLSLALATYRTASHTTTATKQTATPQVSATKNKPQSKQNEANQTKAQLKYTSKLHCRQENGSGVHDCGETHCTHTRP
jgi:hypothetical protein